MSTKLTKNARGLLSLLKNNADHNGAVEITLLERTCDMGVCVNTVVSAVKCLEKNGLITVIRGQRSKNGIGKESAGKNIYHILPRQQEVS